MKCTREGCGFTFPKDWPTDRHRCPSCKHWNIIPETNEDESVLLSDARLSNVERIPTGFLDTVFGGGIARTSVNLIAGPPGAGKTTLFLQLADILTDLFAPRELLYIANEQDPAEIREIARRIGVKNLHRIRVVRAMGGLRRDLHTLLRTYAPCAVILDSLTKLVGDDMGMAVIVAERMKEFTVELNAPSFLVNQVNKDGDHAGLQKLQHAVDATLMLDKDDEDGSRFLYSTKNRFGEAPVGIELEMTPTGLKAKKPDEPLFPDEPPSQPPKRFNENEN